VAGALGLVLNTTSQTVRIERHQSRLNRKRRGVLTAARLIQEQCVEGGRRVRAWFVTTTYRPDVEWNPKQVAEFIDTARHYFKRRGAAFRYIWVWEPTKAGRPHYHLVVWLPLGFAMPKPDVKGWWRHGSTEREPLRKTVGYCAKYAAKSCPADAIPAGARLYGCGGLDASRRAEKSWWLKPGWVRELFTVTDRPARALGGGYQSRTTGAWEPPRWGILSRALDWSWIELCGLQAGPTLQGV
jgi:hypothetical protein